MWIETTFGSVRTRSGANSFASNGECGLKQSPLARFCRPCANSFASNGECGLKQEVGHQRGAARHQFIRQQWRMWIETTSTRHHHDHPVRNSFASNGECGLKQLGLNPVNAACMQFIRQQWRMWIETWASKWKRLK